MQFLQHKYNHHIPFYNKCNLARDCLASFIPINKLPPPTPLCTGGGLIAKRFPLLCKEGLGEVVIKRLTCLTHPQPPGKRGQTKSLLGICRTKGGSRPFRAQYPEGERELIGRELLYNFPYFVFYNLKFTFVLCYL